MTAVDDVVLPSFTNIGEPTCASSGILEPDSSTTYVILTENCKRKAQITRHIKRYEEAESASANTTVIYSSIPPDVNMDSMSRATKSSAGGEMLQVTKRPDGKLSIFACSSAERKSPSVYDRGYSSICVVCRRTIANMEMFLNFPDDLDRRRLWGNMLGFKYSDMLRLRDGSVMLSTGLICTDHFSEECFRVYNFNKAAIETLGMPSVTSPGVKLTPSKKWIPWECTVCPFQSHNVYVMQKHMVDHTDDVLVRYHAKSPRGLLCPFCRKCTYGYKTMSGLRRHLLTPPVQHCQLKRIFEIARTNCRSSLLEPVMKWSSWTDRNVYLAYHGCEPPPRTPRKRPDSALSDQPSEESKTSSPGVLHNSPSTNSAAPSAHPTPSSCTSTPNSTPVSEKSPVSRITPASRAGVFVTPPGVSSQCSPVAQPRSVTRRTPYQNPRRPLIFSSPVKRDATGGVVKPPRTIIRPVLQLRKPLLPDDVARGSERNETANESSAQNADQQATEDNKSRAVAKIILKATSTPNHTLLDALNLISANGEGESFVTDPALTKPLFTWDYNSQELNGIQIPAAPQHRSNKTRRQLESVEARLRIFGDCSRIEVPSGYTAIETRNGVRLVEGGANVHDASAAICLPRGRFVPVSR